VLVLLRLLLLLLCRPLLWCFAGCGAKGVGFGGVGCAGGAGDSAGSSPKNHHAPFSPSTPHQTQERALSHNASMHPSSCGFLPGRQLPYVPMCPICGTLPHIRGMLRLCVPLPCVPLLLLLAILEACRSIQLPQEEHQVDQDPQSLPNATYSQY